MLGLSRRSTDGWQTTPSEHVVQQRPSGRVSIFSALVSRSTVACEPGDGMNTNQELRVPLYWHSPLLSVLHTRKQLARKEVREEEKTCLRKKCYRFSQQIMWQWNG